MNNKTILTKILTIGIIFLFFDVSVSAVSTDIKTPIVNKKTTDNNGLPDLIIEDIFTENIGGMIVYFLLIRNIGDSNYTSNMVYKVNITIEWKVFNIIQKKRVFDSVGNDELPDGVLPPDETVWCIFFVDFNRKYERLNCKFSFSAIVNPDFVMEESNYDNNFYEEVITYSYKTHSIKSNNRGAEDCGCKTKTDDYPIICDILELKMNAVGLKFYSIIELAKKYNLSNDLIIPKLLFDYARILFLQIIIIFTIVYEVFHCSWCKDETLIFQIQFKDLNYMLSK